MNEAARPRWIRIFAVAPTAEIHELGFSIEIDNEWPIWHDMKLHVQARNRTWNLNLITPVICADKQPE
jgi:hypothetical protein